MIAKVLDVTAQFNANNGVKLSLSEWEIATIQFVTPTGTIAIQGSNDANAITGVTDGDAFTSINYTTIQAVDLSSSTGALITTIVASGLYKLTVATKFIQIGGASAQAGKVLIFVNKPY